MAWYYTEKFEKKTLPINVGMYSPSPSGSIVGSLFSWKYLYIDGSDKGWKWICEKKKSWLRIWSEKYNVSAFDKIIKCTE